MNCQQKSNISIKLLNLKILNPRRPFDISYHSATNHGQQFQIFPRHVMTSPKSRFFILRCVFCFVICIWEIISMETL